jgi:hypothetical protein
VTPTERCATADKASGNTRERDRAQRNRDQVQREIRDAVQNNDGGAGWGFDDDWDDR